MEGWIFLLELMILAVLIWLWEYNINNPIIKEKIVVVEKTNYRKSQAVEYLQKHGEITNTEYRELTGVSDTQAVRDLDELEAEGKIEQIGDVGRGVVYKPKN